MIDRQRRSLWRSACSRSSGAARIGTITKSARVIFNCAHKQRLPPKESPPLAVLRSGNTLITSYAAVPVHGNAESTLALIWTKLHWSYK